MKTTSRLRLGSELFALALAASLAAPCRAEWKPLGEFQVASMNVLMQQVQALAGQMKFPLLPMLVKDGFAQCESAQSVGAIDESADWGAKLYVDGDRLAGAWAWPAAGGEKAWKKSHPGAKDGPAFTKDGRYACRSDVDGLARRLASGDAPFAKPMKKGMARLTVEGEDFFSNIEGIINKSAQDFEKETGAKSELPPWHSKFCACAKSLRRFVAIVGVTKHGLDVRMRATPKDGASVDSILAAMKEMGESVSLADKSVAEVFPESAKTKPELVVRISDDPAVARAAGMVAPGNVWFFAWRDGKDVRAVARIVSSDLAKAAESMMQMQMQMQSQELPK